MNNVEKALIIGFVFLLCNWALFQLVTSTAQNTSLDEESTNIITKYVKNYNNITNAAILNDTTNTTGSQVNYEGVDSFYRSTAEAKGSTEKFSSSWKMFAKFPVMLVTSIPFIEAKNLSYIISIFLGLITLFGFIAIYKFWFGGNTNN